MLSINQLISEAADFGDLSKFKKIVIAPGRFNPPHRGHKLMIDKLVEFARELNAEPVVIIADSKKYDSRNPLTGEVRKEYISKMFPSVRCEISRNPYDCVYDLASFQKQMPVGCVAGSDRGRAYEKMVKNIFGDEVEFKTRILVRDPDSSDIAGISSSKAREAARNGDVTKFRYLTGLDDTDANDLMDKIRGDE